MAAAPAEGETEIPSLARRVGMGPARAERELVIPSLARFDVARFGIPPRRGIDKPAQGNALRAAIPRKRVPCKGATSLGYRDVAVAREKPNSVSPRQGSGLAAERVPRALPWADL